MESIQGKTINYWRRSAEEDYMTTPISVLKYISILEEQAKGASLERKIDKLRELTTEFVFPESYPHTDEVMYKILNEYTNYAEDKIVLCPFSEGVEKALDIAYKVIEQKRAEYYTYHKNKKHEKR